jgi:hypothetical protein
MYLWRKIAEPRWLSARENILQARSGGRLAIISRPGRKRRQLEVACISRNDSRKLVEEFGGRTEKLPRNWLKRFACLHRSKPLKVGKRLVIAGKNRFPNPESVRAEETAAPRHSRFRGVWNRRTCNDGNVAPSPRTLDS